jgi:hypothetical protein
VPDAAGAFVVRRSSFVVRRSSFVVRRSSMAATTGDAWHLMTNNLGDGRRKGVPKAS